MDRVRAFAPGNISGVFKIIPHPDPARMHSLGLGLTLSDGVEVEVCRAPETCIIFNDTAISLPTVQTVLSTLSAIPLRVEVSTPLPLSCGFGLSGATALATAYAANALLELDQSPPALALAAHIAEVQHLTGLGDVCAQYHGGCLVKIHEGDPLKARRLAVPEQSLYYRYFSPILTSEVVGNTKQRTRINTAADVALTQLAAWIGVDEVDLDTCITTSLQFAQDSGLLIDSDVLAVIRQLRAAGAAASMIMLGNAVFSTSPFEGSVKTQLALRRAELIP